ncbi:CoA ester lyase [Caulobacter sp.]|uniref:HpcH/HpaI aldolase/citrate lyase family protein n=1 Tax=Caulobacter sp. TaxID=78 RepID=UPI002B4865DF|nr:CoA ester lyase [Caulobacter sp.]HJV40711.1 CoA ester lyase [Caulobacter sp.]
MTTAIPNRPRRSALYMPASNAKAVEKARTLDADVIILDLEDAVAPESKPAAREAAVAAVKAGGFGAREVVIRVNGIDTPWGAEDLAAAAEAGPDAVLVPKVGDAADVRLYDQHLNGAPPATRLWTMIETAKAAFHLWEIAEASHGTRLSAWVMGVNDFAKEMRARQTPDRAPFLPLLTLSVAAARAHGLTILDGVHNDIEDLAALEAVCVQGVDFGFDGKTLIHPKHLEICNRVFSPSPEDIAWSRAVIAAFNAPENSGKGALRVDGKMAERLHLAQAERLVAVAEAIAARG